MAGLELERTLHTHVIWNVVTSCAEPQGGRHSVPRLGALGPDDIYRKRRHLHGGRLRWPT